MPYTVCIPYRKGADKMEEHKMTEAEQRQIVIDTYVNLMRIKACENGENKELDYQIRVTKQKLASYSVDLKELEP